MKQTIDLTAIRPSDDTLWMSHGGVHIGACLIEQHARETPIRDKAPGRIEAMLAIAFGKRFSPELLDAIYAAAKIAREGDPALANIRLSLNGPRETPRRD